jgi:hypothetical protein
VPTAYPKEFRRDVIAVARQGDQSLAQIARLRDLRVVSVSVAADRRS